MESNIKVGGTVLETGHVCPNLLNLPNSTALDNQRCYLALQRKYKCRLWLATSARLACIYQRVCALGYGLLLRMRALVQVAVLLWGESQRDIEMCKEVLEQVLLLSTLECLRCQQES